MTTPFTIESNIAIPARTIPHAGPRESKYPVDQLQEGQAFAVSVRDEKEARQKQSQFSGLGKSRGIKLVTRFFSGVSDETQSPFASTPAPCLGIWHMGKAEPKAPKAPKATAEGADANADASNTGGEASDAVATTDAEALEL